MKSPRFSVITPSYNSAAFIKDAILSVERQQDVDVEHIVIDAASTDSTLEIVKGHDLHCVSEPDRGQSDAINKGFLRAKGDLVGWLNADDYYLPGGLQAIALAARQHPEADVFYGDCVFVDTGGQILPSKVEHEFDRSVLMHFGCYIPSTSTFFRRRIIDKGHLLDCDYRVCMDFEYFARLASAGFRFRYVPQFIAAFRWHGSNVSLRNVGRRAEERRMVQQRFGGCDHGFDSRTVAIYRAKRLLRKAWSGNLERELRVRRMTGENTRWIADPAAWKTCKNLACW